MELEILKNEEKRMNLVMFLFLAMIPCVALGYVILFNGGSSKDCIVLSMVAADVKKFWENMRSICIFAFCPYVESQQSYWEIRLLLEQWQRHIS